MPDILFLSECNADTALVRFLLPPSIQIDHVRGIHNVSNQMTLTSVNNATFRVIGIIDKDKDNVPTYFDQFITINQWDRVTLKQHIDQDHHLIILDKAIETFILWNAEQINLAVADYGFDPTLRQFCKALKRDSILTDPDYLRLLADLHARNAPGFVTLHQLLNDLIIP